MCQLRERTLRCYEHGTEVHPIVAAALGSHAAAQPVAALQYDYRVLAEPVRRCQARDAPAYNHAFDVCFSHIPLPCRVSPFSTSRTGRIPVG